MFNFSLLRAFFLLAVSLITITIFNANFRVLADEVSSSESYTIHCLSDSINSKGEKIWINLVKGRAGYRMEFAKEESPEDVFCYRQIDIVPKESGEILFTNQYDFIFNYSIEIKLGHLTGNISGKKYQNLQFTCF